MKKIRFGLSGFPAGLIVAAALLLPGCSDRKQPATADAGTGGPATAGTAAGTSAGGAPTDVAKCAAHGAPRDLCFICDPSLRDKDRMWCQEHNRYEDRCWECHPELRDPNRLYCSVHSLYEDECFLCHPELLKKRGASAGRPETAAGGVAASGSSGIMCKEHGVPEQECGICHPELLSKKQPGEGLKVRLPSTESAAKAGVEVAGSGVDRMERGIECLAELSFNQNKLAEITPIAEGVVRSVEVDLGSRVRKGALLARLQSPAMSEAQSAYLRALAEEDLREKSLERERKLRSQSISSERDVQEADAAHKNASAALRQAKQHLLVLGFTDDRIRGLAAGEAGLGDLEIRAPFAGEVVERAAVQGALAEAGKRLFTIVDTATLWAMVNIPESQLSSARVGQKVRLTVESLPGEIFVGRLTWLPAQVDQRTRMARGRAEVDNPDGRLKAQMFARALIITSEAGQAVVVPRSALQNIEGTTVVFVKAADDLYEARPVQVGAQRHGEVEIVAGLRPDEPVVISGGFALKSQFLISRLGAGCVD